MSHITVSAAKVIQCCENWKTYWSIRDCYKASIILAKKAKEKKYIIFGKPIGYQKAYEYYTQDASDYFDTLKFSCCFWGGETGQSVENLLRLAKHGDPVIISDKHAFILDFEET